MYFTFDPGLTVTVNFIFTLREPNVYKPHGFFLGFLATFICFCVTVLFYCYSCFVVNQIKLQSKVTKMAHQLPTYGLLAVQQSTVALIIIQAALTASNGIEITIIRFMILPHVTIIGIYQSPNIPVRLLCLTLRELLYLLCTQFSIFIGDFNINWFNEKEKIPVSNVFELNTTCSYKQLVSSCTTDNKTCIDHIYTNLPDSRIKSNILECYFSDHKTIYALLNCFP